jgi:5,6,7,8-tetrahydromethanopterin hydro-lyase
MDSITFSTGEATVFAAEGQLTDAMPEIVIGDIAGPVGQAFANLMGQTAGHPRMFAIRATNQTVKPATLMVPKVTVKSNAYVELLGGPMQSAVADAVLDCVIEGTIPRPLAERLCIIATLWLEPKCAVDPNLDRKDLYRTNYEAMKIAVARAVKGEPTLDELIENRQKIHHEMYDPQTGASQW